MTTVPLSPEAAQQTFRNVAAVLRGTTERDLLRAGAAMLIRLWPATGTPENRWALLGRAFEESRAADHACVAASRDTLECRCARVGGVVWHTWWRRQPIITKNTYIPCAGA